MVGRVNLKSPLPSKNISLPVSISTFCQDLSTVRYPAPEEIPIVLIPLLILY